MRDIAYFVIRAVSSGRPVYTRANNKAQSASKSHSTSRNQSIAVIVAKTITSANAMTLRVVHAVMHLRQLPTVEITGGDVEIMGMSPFALSPIFHINRAKMLSSGNISRVARFHTRVSQRTNILYLAGLESHGFQGSKSRSYFRIYFWIHFRISLVEIGVLLFGILGFSPGPRASRDP